MNAPVGPIAPPHGRTLLFALVALVAVLIALAVVLALAIAPRSEGPSSVTVSSVDWSVAGSDCVESPQGHALGETATEGASVPAGSEMTYSLPVWDGFSNEGCAIDAAVQVTGNLASTTTTCSGFNGTFPVEASNLPLTVNPGVPATVDVVVQTPNCAWSGQLGIALSSSGGTG